MQAQQLTDQDRQAIRFSSERHLTDSHFDKTAIIIRLKTFYYWTGSSSKGDVDLLRQVELSSLSE